MSSALTVVPPPDRAERERSLDAARSVLVEAPAGSGKTDLLARRFLGLLAVVDEPGQIVAITFTKAAAAEMRHRILAELEKAAGREEVPADADAFSMEALAARALERSRARGWNLIELPAQLRITTIDAFCRELAVQQPLLSGLGGGLDISEDPKELYRRAARKTLERIDEARPELREAIATLLLWRDNGWQEMESLLVEMLARRDRWMRDFVFGAGQDEALRERLERPFARAIRSKLEDLNNLLDGVAHARQEALELARFACEQTAGALHRELAELAEFPAAPFDDTQALEDARQACVCLAKLLQTQKGEWRLEKGLNATGGFPATDPGRAAKRRFAALIADLRDVRGLDAALAAVSQLPPARYTEEDWLIVRACFVLLRHAAAQLKVEFAEAGAVDYAEVAQIALQMLRGEEGIPGEAALAAADGIRHLLVDEFQDTSRRQHDLLRTPISAWPEREGRTCFVVGDPMQSIYFFRDADAELFPQVRDGGLTIPDDQPLVFENVSLRTNFRTVPALIERINDVFTAVFAKDEGSGVRFTPSESPRRAIEGPALFEEEPRLRLHVEFVPAAKRGRTITKTTDQIAVDREAAREKQIAEIVAAIRSHAGRMEKARGQGRKYRVAVLGRARAALAPIAEALREAQIPFRAVELEKLQERPEIMDALAMARALLNPHDRVAWLGLLRAPWCGLSLADLHTLVSTDNPELCARPVRELMAERRGLLTNHGRSAVERVLRAVESADALRTARPEAAVGTWLEQAWQQLGGPECVDATARVNLDLLWATLDSLPEGEESLLGPALDAALEKLTALSDPAADSECGVQLMTIHKAKGLEFEVVIVPELQAAAGRNLFGLLSWLERGLAAPGECGEATEFLVAPIAVKGGDFGGIRKWVDREYREREKQEARRVLYVAATRAREELHFFARPAYKTEQNLSRTLVEPKDSLLATAWPALGEEIGRRFGKWREATSQRELEGGAREGIALEHEDVTLESIAASSESHLLDMPAPVKPTVLRRLPANYSAEQSAHAAAADSISGLSAGPFYRRHEGGLLSRALGIAAHAVLEEMAKRRQAQEWDAVRKEILEIKPRLIAGARAAGLDLDQARRVAEQALEIALQASRDSVAQWILSPHAEAASEARWAGVDGDAVHAVRVDRVFRAGLEPRSEEGDAWWIIDYKTAHAEGLDTETALPELRAIFAPQLEAYARVLRNLHGADAELRAGLYYPRMRKLDWWEV